MAKFIYTDTQYIPFKTPEETVLEAAKAVEALVKWTYCDCGCPKQRKPSSPKDADFLRIAAFIRVNLIDDK